MNALPIVSEKLVKVSMEEPVVVDQAPSVLPPPELPPGAAPHAISGGAKEWGRWRLPKIYRLPGGELCATYSMSIDHHYDQGRDSPVFTSKDEGASWAKAEWPHPGLSGMHPCIYPVFNGEYYSIPAVNGINVEPYDMPEQEDVYITVMKFAAYRLAECPKPVADWYRDIKAVRWSPESGWTDEQAVWEHEGQYIRTYHDKAQSIPGTWGQRVFVESPIMKCGNELFLADYWTTFEDPPGKIPKFGVSCLMCSTDNGHTWKKRSVVPQVPMFTGEPAVEMNHAGEFVFAVRSEPDPFKMTEKYPATMYMTFSRDKGHTWDEMSPVLSYGVFPQLLQLGNGIMALSYGRAPGTWVSFSLDGGHSWTEPYAIIDETGKKTSDGYTSLLSLGPDRFIIIYGDIHYKNAAGEECKTILTRVVTVNKA